MGLGRKLYIAVLAAGLAFAAAGFLVRCLRQVYLPFELDYGEGIVLWQALLLDDPAHAFKPVAEYPHIVFHYPPVYHYLCRFAFRFTDQWLAAGRWISFLAALGVALALFTAVRAAFPRRLSRLAVFTGAAFAASGVAMLPVMNWCPLLRVDLAGMFFTFAGLAVFVAAGPASRWRYAAFGCFLLAIYSKQTLAPAPAACAVAGFLAAPRKTARVVLAFAAAGLAVFAVFSWVTRGGFLSHLFLYNLNPFSAFAALRSLGANLRGAAPWVLLALVPGLSLLLRMNRSSPPPLRALRAGLLASPYRRAVIAGSLHLGFAFLVALTAGKAGSNYNYFLEWNLECCLLAGLLLTRVLAVRPFAISPALALVLLVPLLLLARNARVSWRILEPPAADREELRRELAEHNSLLDLVRKTPGQLLSDNMTVLVLAGKAIPAEPLVIKVLAESGTWDERPFVERIAQRRFPLIIVRNLASGAKYTIAMRNAIQGSYAPAEIIGSFTVYRPRGA